MHAQVVVDGIPLGAQYESLKSIICVAAEGDRCLLSHSCDSCNSLDIEVHMYKLSIKKDMHAISWTSCYADLASMHARLVPHKHHTAFGCPTGCCRQG